VSFPGRLFDELQFIPTQSISVLFNAEIDNSGFPAELNEFLVRYSQLPAEVEVVGGEFLPIDSTALMLAELQTNAIWMLPVLAGAVGTGFAAFKLRKRI